MANLAGQKTITQLSAEVAEYLFANTAASSVTYPTATRITQLVNDKYREICSEKDWWFLFASGSFNTVAGTYNYAMDDLAIEILSMVIPSVFLKLKFMPRYMQLNSFPGGQASISNALPLVYIPAAPASNNALSFDLLPTPDAIYAISYWYKKRVADLASTSVPVIPPEWQDILVHGAAYEAFAMLGNKDRTEYHQAIFNKRRRLMWLEDESNMDWQNTLRSFSQETSVSSYPGLVQPYRD